MPKTKTKKHKRKSKRIPIIIISLVLVSIVFSAGIILYWYYNIFPQKIIGDMQKKTLEIQSHHFKGKARIFGESGDSAFDLTFDLDGRSDSKNKALALSLEPSGIFGDLPMNADLDLIMLEDTSYFKVNQLPVLLKSYENLDDIENRWAETESSYNESNGNILANEDLFYQAKIMGYDNVNGNSTYKIQARISVKEIQEMIVFEDSNLFLTSEETNNLIDALSDSADYTFYLWIGKDNYLYRIEGEVPFIWEGGNLSLEFSIEADEFDKQMYIKVPEIFESAEEVFKAFIK